MSAIISIRTLSAVEERFSNFVEFVVSLSQPEVDVVNVSYRTLGDTAGYYDLDNSITGSSNNGILSFKPGETTKSIFIEADSDSLDERDENFSVELFNPSSNASFENELPTVRSTGIILDDDGDGPNISLIVSSLVITEGNSGQKNAIFEVKLSQPAPSGFSADYKTINGTAIAGEDYVNTTGSLSFSPGQQTTLVTVPIIGDTIGEGAEFFSLLVTPPSSPSIGSDASVGEANIIDTDASPLPEISIEGGVASERFSDYVRFVVTLSEPAVDAVTVNFNTFAGTALDSDLDNSITGSSNNGVLTFKPGETSLSIFIEADSDTLDERDESFSVRLSSPTNAVLANNVEQLTATGFILDDDGVGLNIALAGAEQILSENIMGNSIVYIPVELSRPASDELTFNVVSNNGTAISGLDFVLRDTTVTFATGQQKAAVAIEILKDNLDEGNESFSLSYVPISGSAFAGIIPEQKLTLTNAGISSELRDQISENPIVANGITAAYETLLKGIPNQTGYEFLINSAISTNFGAGSNVSFNSENIFINLINNLVQGNVNAKVGFNTLATGNNLVEKITSIYKFVIPVSEQSSEGLAFLTRSEGLQFYQNVATERGVEGIDGAAIVALASLLNIAVVQNIGIGNSINDFVAAVLANSSPLPSSGSLLTSLEFADGSQFDGDDASTSRLSYDAPATDDEVTLIQTISTVDDPFVMV